MAVKSRAAVWESFETPMPTWFSQYSIELYVLNLQDERDREGHLDVRKATMLSGLYSTVQAGSSRQVILCLH